MFASIALASLILGGFSRIDDESTTDVPQGFVLSRLATIVPEGTLLLASFPSLRKHWKQFETLPLYKLYRDPEVQAFLRSTGSDFEGIAPDVRDAMARFVVSIPDSFDGELGLALIALDGKELGRAIADWALLLSSVERENSIEETFTSTLVPFLAGTFAWGPEKRTVEGTDVVMFEGPRYSIFLAQLGGDILAAGSEHRLADLIRRSKTTSPSLSTTKPFRDATSRVVNQESSALLYFDAGRVRDLWLEKAPMWMGQALRGTGLDGIDVVSGGVSISNGSADDTMWFSAPRGRKGILEAIVEMPIEPLLARVAPEDTFFFFDANLRIEDLRRTLLEASDSADEKSPLATLVEELGLRGLPDVVRNLGPRMGFFITPEILEVAVVFGVKDRDALQADLFAATRTLTDSEPGTLTYRDRKIHYVKNSSRGPFGIGVSWCVNEDHLLVAPHPTILKRVLERIDLVKPSLEGTTAFRDAWKTMPENAPLAGYINTKQLVHFVYNFAWTHETPFNPFELPDVAMIESYVSCGLSGLSVEEGEFILRTRTEGYGPTSSLLYMLEAWILWKPLGEWANASSQWGACPLELKRIYQWLVNTQQMKDRIEVDIEMGESGESYSGSFKVSRFHSCPDVEPKTASLTADTEDVQEHPKSMLIGYDSIDFSKFTELPQDEMIVWDSEPRHRGGRHVLLRSGEVRWYPERAIQKRLEEKDR